MSACRAEFFLRNRMAIRGGTGLGFLTEARVRRVCPRVFTLKTITGSCRDYRACATCDYEMDTADKDRKIAMPLMMLWGARGPDRSRISRCLARIRHQCAGRRLPCGHYMQEEVPDQSMTISPGSSLKEEPVAKLSAL